jgi:hypothetical protein
MSRVVKTEGRRARRKFTAEFKAGTVRLVLDEGRSSIRQPVRLKSTVAT